MQYVCGSRSGRILGSFLVLFLLLSGGTWFLSSSSEELPPSIISPFYVPGPGVDTSPREIGTRATGTAEVLILCIDFVDKTAQASTASYGSRLTEMDDYYKEVSYGKFGVNGTVGPIWYRSSKPMTFYGSDSGTSHDSLYGPIYELVKEVLDLADDDLDYNDYDKDNDGVLDHLIVVHSGEDQSETGNSTDIWSHKSAIPGGYSLDGIKIEGYTMTAESSDIGTFVHEFGHDIGLPDLYDYGYESDGVGIWCLMGMGNILNKGATPGHMCAWSKIKLGWIDPIVVEDILDDVVLPPVESEPVCYKLPISDTEYFLVENRQPLGNDLYIPGRGLMIYHVDEKKYSDNPAYEQHWKPNEDEDHKFIDVEESTSVQDLDLGFDVLNPNVGDDTDPWLTSVDGFSYNSDPSSESYYMPGIDTKVWIRNITFLSGYKMQADFGINYRKVDIYSMNQTISTIPIDEPISFKFQATSNRLLGDSFTVEIEGPNADWALANRTFVNVTGPQDIGLFELTVKAPPDALVGEKAGLIIRLRNQEGYVTKNITMSLTVDPFFEIGFDQVPLMGLSTDQTTKLPISILNLGNLQANLDLNLIAPIGFSTRIEPPELNISAFSNTTVNIFITPGRTVRGGNNYSFELEAIWKDDPMKRNSTSFSSHLTAERGLTLSAIQYSPIPLSISETNTQKFLLSNVGNRGEDITIDLDITDPGGLDLDNWTFSVGQDIYSVAPFSTREIVVIVKVPDDVSFSEDPITFNISAKVQGGPSAKYSGTFVIERLYDIEFYTTGGTLIPLDLDSFNVVPIQIVNRGNHQDNMDISITTQGNISATIGTRIISLEPWGTLDLELNVTSGKFVPVGIYYLNITATSRSNASFSKSYPLRINIKPSTLLEVTLDEVFLDGVNGFIPGETYRMELTIRNIGNFIDTLQLDVNATKGFADVRFYFQDGTEVEPFDIGIGETIVLTVEVRTRKTDVQDARLEIIVTNSQNKVYTQTVDFENERSGLSIPMAVFLIFLVFFVTAGIFLLFFRRRFPGPKDNKAEPDSPDTENESSRQKKGLRRTKGRKVLEEPREERS